MNSFYNSTPANTKMQMSNEQKEYLLNNYHLSNKQIAEHLNVSESKIYLWLQELGIKKKKGWKARQSIVQGEYFKHDKNLATI